MSSNGKIFHVTGHLCKEFTSEFPSQKRPVTQSFGVFFDLHLIKWLSKQSWGWWFETPLWGESTDDGFTTQRASNAELWYIPYCYKLLNKQSSCQPPGVDLIQYHPFAWCRVLREHDNIWPGGARRQGLSRHGVDLGLMEYSTLSTRGLIIHSHCIYAKPSAFKCQQ